MQQFESNAKRNDKLERKGLSLNQKVSKREKEKIDRARPFILGAAKRKREDDESSVSSEEFEFTDDDDDHVNDNESLNSEEESVEESDVDDILATDDEVNDSDDSDFDDDSSRITRRRVNYDSGSDDGVSIGIKGLARKRIRIDESSGEESDVEPNKKKQKKEQQQTTTGQQSQQQQTQQQPVQSTLASIKQLQKQQKRQEICHFMKAHGIEPINNSDRKWVQNLMEVTDYYIDYGHQLIRRKRLDPYVEDWAYNQRISIVNGDITPGNWKYALLGFIRFVVGE